MGKVLKWAGIGCGGMLGVLVVVAIIITLVSGGGSDEPEVSVADNSSERATSSEVNTKDDSSTESTSKVSVGDNSSERATSSEVNTKDDSSTEGAEDVPQIPDGRKRTEPLPRGYSITHDDFKVTILDVSYSTDEGGVLASLEDDHVWAIVKLRLESVGDPNKSYRYNTSNFRMVGDMSTIYDDWISTPDDDIGAGEVFGGGVVEGNIIRQVHKDDTNLVLIFSPSFRGSRYLALESSP